jgi:pimeloyl-ACP methyl ester carboxylesterase
MPARPARKRKKSYQPDPFHPALAMSAHGILTHGHWQKLFGASLSGSPTHVDSFDYGYYGLTRFLTPRSNQRKLNEFHEWYFGVIKSVPEVDLNRFDKRPSLVAHSLGSWIVGNAMLKHPGICFDKIILAGSILPQDFDWATLFARGQISLVRNECGQKDPWPHFAKIFVARTGTAGKKGFDWYNTHVQNVRCEWFGHSDSLMRAHIETQWLPFLRQPPSPTLDILHGHEINDESEFDRILNYSGGIIDEEAYGKIEDYNDVRIQRSLSKEWIRQNPDIYTFLIDRHTRLPAGYINAMPVSDDLYAGLRSGKVQDNQVPRKGILPFLGRKPVKIYIMSIAIAEKYRRWGEGIFQRGYAHLFTGFLNKLINYAKNDHIRVTHLLATAWTDEGVAMCRDVFQMVEVGKDKEKFPIFELDLRSMTEQQSLSPALKRLFKVYSSMN